MSGPDLATSNYRTVLKCLGAIVLFTAWPLLNFANQNREQLDSEGTHLLVLTFVAAVLGAWLGFFAVHALTRRRRPIAACAAVCLFLVLFFSYHLIYDTLVTVFAALGLNRGENPAYAVIVVVLCSACLFFFKRESMLQPIVLFGLIVIMIPGLQLILFSVSTRAEGQIESVPSLPLPPMQEELNIFHFIADSYPRADALLRFLDFENTEFVRSLEKRGFYIASEAHSNYPSTFLSISSTLSMGYLVTEQTPRFESRERFYRILGGDNPVVDYVLGEGYHYVHQGSVVWDGSRCGGREERCLSTGRAFAVALVDLTPLRRFVKRQRPSAIVDIAARVDDIFDVEQPVFLFSHTMPPHPPRAFDTECRELRLRGRQAPLRDFWGDQEAYLSDLECVNQQFLAVADALIERDPDAVIVFHGDHGSAFGVDWSLPVDSWPGPQFDERFSILLAIRIPERCRHLLYPTLSPVNIYPIVFGCLSDEDPVLKTDVSYVSPHEKHPDYGTAYRYRSWGSGGED